MAVSDVTKSQRQKSEERLARLVVMYTSGATLQQCGDAFGISRERARQILAKAGIAKADGGQCVKVEQKRRAYREGVLQRREERAMRLYGAPFHACVDANAGLPLREKGCLAYAYRLQRHNAEARGIAWTFTFPEWVSIWKESGHLNQRGRTKDSYVMARRGDNGPYAPWNVHIITLAENGREYQNVTRIIRGTKNKQFTKTTNKTGFRGVSFDGKFYRAYISIGRGKTRHLGRSDTAEEAARAYDAAAIERFGSNAILNFPSQSQAA